MENIWFEILAFLIASSVLTTVVVRGEPVSIRALGLYEKDFARYVEGSEYISYWKNNHSARLGFLSNAEVRRQVIQQHKSRSQTCHDVRFVNDDYNEKVPALILYEVSEGLRNVEVMTHSFKVNCVLTADQRTIIDLYLVGGGIHQQVPGGTVYFVYLFQVSERANLFPSNQNVLKLVDRVLILGRDRV